MPYNTANFPREVKIANVVAATIFQYATVMWYNHSTKCIVDFNYFGSTLLSAITSRQATKQQQL